MSAVSASYFTTVDDPTPQNTARLIVLIVASLPHNFQRPSAISADTVGLVSQDFVLLMRQSAVCLPAKFATRHKMTYPLGNPDVVWQIKSANVIDVRNMGHYAVNLLEW